MFINNNNTMIEDCSCGTPCWNEANNTYRKEKQYLNCEMLAVFGLMHPRVRVRQVICKMWQHATFLFHLLLFLAFLKTPKCEAELPFYENKITSYKKKKKKSMCRPTSNGRRGRSAVDALPTDWLRGPCNLELQYADWSVTLLDVVHHYCLV